MGVGRLRAGAVSASVFFNNPLIGRSGGGAIRATGKVPSRSEDYRADQRERPGAVRLAACMRVKWIGTDQRRRRFEIGAPVRAAASGFGLVAGGGRLHPRSGYLRPEPGGGRFGLADPSGMQIGGP